MLVALLIPKKLFLIPKGVNLEDFKRIKLYKHVAHPNIFLLEG